MIINLHVVAYGTHARCVFASFYLLHTFAYQFRFAKIHDYKSAAVSCSLYCVSNVVLQCGRAVRVRFVLFIFCAPNLYVNIGKLHRISIYIIIKNTLLPRDNALWQGDCPTTIGLVSGIENICISIFVRRHNIPRQNKPK